MNSRHQTAFTVVLFLTLIIGCNTRARDDESPRAVVAPAFEPQVIEPADDAAEPVDLMDANRGTIEALTRKAHAYAEEMESKLADRPPPQQDDSAPSAVQWETDGQRPAQELPMEVQPDGAPRAAELADQRPGPSWGEKLPAAGDMPAIVPEEADHPDSVAEDASAPAGSLRRQLAARIEQDPADLAAHLDYQLLRFLHDEQVPQMAAIAALPAEDQELVAALLDGLSNFRSALRTGNNMLLSGKVRPLLSMADRLRSQAELSIPTAALCRRVDGFGVYEPIEPARFIAGREHQAILYCEVKNFASHLNDAGRWETQLTQEVVLYTETGMPVWQDRSRTITDLSRNRRSDFFIVKMIRLPANLTIGRYLLKVTVIDQQSDRVAEATVSLLVVAQ